MRAQWKRWTSGTAVRSLLMVCYDAASTFTAIQAAWSIRFEGNVPPQAAASLAFSMRVIVVARVLTLVAAGLHRWSFSLPGRSEAVRLFVAQSAASVLFYVTATAMNAGVPRSIYPLEFLVSSVFIVGFRYAPDVVLAWRRERGRVRSGGLARTLIVGAGEAGALLARDIRRNTQSKYLLVGFVDDDEEKIGTYLVGRPVLGKIEDLAEVVRGHRVSAVLVAIANLPPERVRRLLELCASCKATFKIIPSSFTEMDSRVSAAMLHDLSPDDLLPRDSVAFDAEEIRRGVEGRTVLVTGAGGSIGGEISRQLAAHGAGTLVLVDMNENELYVSARLLAEDHPYVTVRPEVADIREWRRLRSLGERYRPHYVFHAAAHKHVPLMEDAPEEAIKNNVFGTRNAARMAIRCGAERFVLISTDKAVKPSSVMGASKRIAELVVRDLAGRTPTRMTAVRFGNVLGSAGSVIPIFKRQIERGGPVTLTHPDCTRYFMTIREAVGLVLLAGLRCEGDLCVLEMGAPMRIIELARNLITMAGRVPGEEIPIIFTGLRPGEKLCEELLSEEEEQTGEIRDGIRVARGQAPPPRFRAKLAVLRRLARTGETAALLAAVEELVPSSRLAGAPRRPKIRTPSTRATHVATAQAPRDAAALGDGVEAGG